MADSTKKPKGILKKPTPAPDDDGPPTPTPKAREVALQHANIIHQRRGLEDTITDSIIALAKLPLSREPPYSSANPSPTDAATFKSQVRLFQPSDYEDLISERNANKLCGYTLCPKPRTHVSQSGEFKLVNWGRSDFNIVPKKEIERWCSQACARRAMYVKVQLNESAAWERAGIDSIGIELYEEPGTKKAGDNDAAERLARELDGLKVESERKAVKDARELALERGDAGEKKRARRPVKVRIKESKITGEVTEPSLEEGGEDGHLMLDGYKTRFDPQAHKSTAEEIQE